MSRPYLGDRKQAKTRIPEPLYEAAKEKAKAEKRTITSVLAAAVALYVGVPAVPPPLQVKTPSTVLILQDLWTPILPALKEKVSEQNFEIWLKDVRFQEASDTKVTLTVPNPFFKEYLSEHYLDVIEEQLQLQHGKALAVLLVLPELAKEPAPLATTTLLSAPPALLSPEPQTKEALEMRQQEEEAAELARYKAEAISTTNALQTAAYGERNAAQKILAAEHEANKKKLQLRHAQERDQLIALLSPALLRRPGNPHDQRQYPEQLWRESAGDKAKRSTPLLGSASQSAFSTTGPATRADVRDLDKALKKPDSS